MNSSFASKSKQMASYDVGPAKSLDRNLGNAKVDPQHTIMTAHEPAYSRHKLDMASVSKKDMVFFMANFHRPSGMNKIEVRSVSIQYC